MWFGLQNDLPCFSHYDDKEYSEYGSNSRYTRSESGTRRSGKNDVESSRCYLGSEERNEPRYSSSTMGKQRSASPYSINSAVPEIRSKSKSPSRRSAK